VRACRERSQLYPAMSSLAALRRKGNIAMSWNRKTDLLESVRSPNRSLAPLGQSSTEFTLDLTTRASSENGELAPQLESFRRLPVLPGHLDAAVQRLRYRKNCSASILKTFRVESAPPVRGRKATARALQNSFVRNSNDFSLEDSQVFPQWKGFSQRLGPGRFYALEGGPDNLERVSRGGELWDC